jgi:hypothetical protein
MKRLLLFFLCGFVLASSGCRTRYDITLTTGSRITNVSRPVLDKESGAYHYRDAGGNPQRIPAMRVRSIEAR